MRVAFNSPARNQFHQISPGRPLRSRRRFEKPDMHVRLVLLAPSVTVAEWLGVRLWIAPRGFNSLRSPQSCGRSSVGRERGLPKPEAAGSIPAAHSRSKIRGLGKRINPLGLGPRESRFESEVPDQFLWGSQAVRRLAVTQFIRRFESCPRSQNAGVAFWLRAPVLQTGAVEFDPLPRYQLGVPSRGRSVAGRRSLKPSTLVRFQPSAPPCVRSS
jgi:hypothetical protein